MTENLLIYFVTEGPISDFCPDGTEVWYVEARVSEDGGETVRSVMLTFETEEDAIQFKHEVNSEMEPLKLGEDDED